MKTTEDFKNGPDFADLLQTLGSFLAWATEDGAMYGGVQGEEAFEAFTQLMGWDDATKNRFYEIFVGSDL